MSSGSLSDIVAALSDAFSQAAEPAPPALGDLKRSLSAYTTRNRKSDTDSTTRLQDELLHLFKLHVEPNPKKLALFMTVLKHLRPAILAEDDLVKWFNIAVKPFVEQPDARRCSSEDARDFVVGSMVYDDEALDARERARTCATLASILLDAYMARTSPPCAQNQDLSIQLKGQAAQHLQSMLVAFGRKKAKDLFLAIDNYLVLPDSRFQALGLLAAFVEQQQAHLYLVVHTDVVEHLLKCLMNDTSTVVVSAALRCLIMLLPHMPSTVATQLPRLFLIYSRCLCWEKFSASSTKAQRDLVTDERVRQGSESGDSDYENTDTDPTWATLHPSPDMSESSAPELLHYFTYLYGLYPLNFLAYVRKPRKYLKNIRFPGAAGFDLDQAVIRSRTEQFQRVHLLHPSFFNTTIEDELAEHRWLKAEPSEVIAECHGLYVGQPSIPSPPDPPPAGQLPALPPPPKKLPSLPPLPALDAQAQSEEPRRGATSPTLSRTTHEGGIASQRGSPTLSPAKDSVASPTRRSSNATADGPQPASLLKDVIQLQRDLMLIRNELTFERYLKQQHVAAIGQLRRNHIKAVTIEAETATLINANRALQKKLSDANNFNEKMQKETQARRTHTKQSEDQLTTKIRFLKADLTKQETIQRELEQASKDCEQLRQLLVESEARELAKQDELERSRDSAQEGERLRREILELQRQIRMHRQRETQFKTTQTEHEMTTQELESTRMLLKDREQELDRSRKAFQAKIFELEAQLDFVESKPTGSTHQEEQNATVELQAALEDTRHKLTQTKNAYTQLLDDYTNVKIRYQELLTSPIMDVGRRTSASVRAREPSYTFEYRSQDGSMDRFNQLGNARNPYYVDRGPGQVDMYTLQASQQCYPPPLPSNHPSPVPSNHHPVRPMRPEVYQQRMMDATPMSRSTSGYSDGSHTYTGAGWNASSSIFGSSDYGRSEYALVPPAMVRESSKSAFSINSEDSRRSSSAADKIKAKSEVRVYGRGGAQNIKMKTRDKVDKPEKASKSSTFKGLKGIL